MLERKARKQLNLFYFCYQKNEFIMIWLQLYSNIISKEVLY